MLAYHIVHTIRFQLKASEIDLSWASLRRHLCTQQHVTVELKRAEPRQQIIYDALGMNERTGKTETTVI